MFLRHSIKQRGGKRYTYWRLVRSVRRNGKVVQETVAHLGELDARGRGRARRLAAQMMGRAEQRELFEEPLGAEEAIAIRLRAIRTERARQFGNVWLGWTLWRATKLDELCERLLAQGREEIPWATMAAVLVIARLCEPSSELHIAEDWYRRTALDDVLGLPAEKVNDDRLYRALDRLMPHKEAIEQHLKRRLGELFALDYDLLLYDVTSSYFEGEAQGNELAARGYSRDHRPDCKQVCIALVVTREGMPLGYELFEGNRVDVTTVEHIVETMERRFGVAQRVWVMDRGMCSERNLAWLRAGERRYLIGAPKSEINKWMAAVMSREDWQAVREGVEAKVCTGPEGEEAYVLCRSSERKVKERAMHDRFKARIEHGLATLQARVAKLRHAADRSAIERQIGRLLQRNSRAAGRYAVTVAEDASCAAGVRIQWCVRAQWDAWAEYSEGCYVLRTNVTDWTPEQLWATYVQLTEAEDAFRIQKSDLKIRPIWHQKTERVRAHILVCFLAYVLWKTLEQWQARAGLGNSPRTIVEELARIYSSDVVLPTAAPPPRELRVRCVVRPDKPAAVLLARLGLRLPERLRIKPGYDALAVAM